MAKSSAKTRAKSTVDAAPVAAATGARSVWREYAEAIGMAVLLALFIRSFIFQAFKIPSGSMLPTLLIGDHLLVNKFVYGIRIPILGQRVIEFAAPQRGDVVVFVFPDDRDKDFIKRVQGLPGQTIQIRNKILYVDGERAADPHASFTTSSMRNSRADNFGPFVVPDDELFVLGDNRDHSHDSRFWGTVPMDDVLGKAFVLYWSWDHAAFRPRWGRIGDRIP